MCVVTSLVRASGLVGSHAADHRNVCFLRFHARAPFSLFNFISFLSVEITWLRVVQVSSVKCDSTLYTVGVVNEVVTCELCVVCDLFVCV